ncbi:MAG: AIPR family protein [Clostridia bacterium]|nr:AIPR family protein [Clostridia bacterium]
MTYNNSQNSIDEKTFEANNVMFQRIKAEFESKGFLLLTKQSDKNTFTEKYRKSSELSKLKGKSIERRQIFGLDSLKNTSDFYIPLEKFLQVIVAFKVGGLEAFTQKKDVLNPNSQTYTSVIDFIKSSNVTTDVLLSLYLLYMRAEKDKNAWSRTNYYVYATPISFYLIDAFKRYECKNDINQIMPLLSTKQLVDKVIKIYTIACDNYTTQFTERNKVEYIKMIKMSIDYSLLKTCRDQAERNIVTMSAFAN